MPTPRWSFLSSGEYNPQTAVQQSKSKKLPKASRASSQMKVSAEPASSRDKTVCAIRHDKPAPGTEICSLPCKHTFCHGFAQLCETVTHILSFVLHFTSEGPRGPCTASFYSSVDGWWLT